VILIKKRPALFLPTDVLKYRLKRAFGVHGPFVAIASFTIGYGTGNSRQSFLNGSRILFCGMDHEDASAWFVPALRRSYARLAAWMVRDNRSPEPSRLPAPTRAERPSRIADKPRRPAPPRA
jgi:hypothetical protein